MQTSWHGPTMQTSRFMQTSRKAANQHMQTSRHGRRAANQHMHTSRHSLFKSFALLVVLLPQRLALAFTMPNAANMEQQAVAAASVVRVNGSYRTGPGCTWPECAPTCMSCPATRMGKCLIKPFENCKHNMECIIGTCFCADGFCSVGGKCVNKTCSLGAKPPIHQPSGFVRRFAELGPDPPGRGARREQWMQFLIGNATPPIALLVVGVILAGMTCACVCCRLDYSCSCLPVRPWLLLVLCFITASVMVGGIWSRALVVDQSFDLAEEQVRRMNVAVDQAVQLANQLDVMCQDLQVQVDGLFGSCSPFAFGANEMMNKAATKANHTLAQMTAKVNLFSRVSALASKYLGILEEKLPTARKAYKYLPMGPMLVLLLWTVIIALAALVTIYHPDPDVAEVVDDFAIRFGSVGTCLVMLVAACLSAGYTFAGMIIGSVCLDLDNNMMNAIQLVNFTEVAHYKHDINPVIQGAARYYIQGSQENPLSGIVSSAQNDATALYDVYTNATWATGPLAMVCKGVTGLKPQYAMVNFDRATAWLLNIIQASHLWPFYKTFSQDIVCGTMLHSMTLLIACTTIVAFILMPALSILADLDFRKWAQHKEMSGTGSASGVHEYAKVPSGSLPQLQRDSRTINIDRRST
eukprot:TRINITY_DN21893_c0_g1_i1.p1 TRINITY_DN21893_c0_g1~~TRINITY_DN21893_c0_g1_i1.p1  ORF type:complete len:638 (-),score=79.46 TRINITY_DN21893_c0_g1_i1:132-2045(-)